MRFTHIAALACASLGVLATAVPVHLVAPAELTAVSPRPVRGRQRQFAPESPYSLRSRGPQAKSKRKSNRVTLSRRVRRKHRRAA